MQSQPEDSDEAGAFLQPTFINILNELNAVTERLLLPEAAQIEADTKVCCPPPLQAFQSSKPFKQQIVAGAWNFDSMLGAAFCSFLLVLCYVETH